ncbi:MAG TPA: hypothetical protein VMW87_07935 [Spirochaetia bacterium]|nr:hypothetical protein [Spirochaetia bacterium]
MSPIDDIYIRIQQITNRIREIQNLGRRPPGNNGDVSPLPRGNQAIHPAALSAGSQTGVGRAGKTSAPHEPTAAVSPADLAAAGTSSFDSLLNEALSAGAGSSAAAGDNGLGLSGVGDLGGIDSLLGSQDTTRLQDYQNLLLKAVRDLQNRKGTNNGAQAQ